MSTNDSVIAAEALRSFDHKMIEILLEGHPVHRTCGGLCKAIHPGRSGMELELADGSHWVLVPERIDERSIACGLSGIPWKSCKIRVKTFVEYSAEEAYVVAREAVKASSSLEEVRRRLTDAGFNGSSAALTCDTRGGWFFATAMTRGPHGEMISV